MSNHKTHREIKYINIHDLLLDPDNPRLLGYTSEKNQKQVFKHIIKYYAIDELVKAIGENDYFAGEPLIVIPSQEDSGKYIVVEGNRRLSALNILNDPNSVENDNNLKSFAENAKHKPKDIPCVLFEDRNEVLSYLGLRHVVGIKSWGPLAKARYTKKVFDKIKEDISLDEKIKQVARSMGSRGDHIKRNLLTFYIYELIKNQSFFELNDVKETTFQFYVFYMAISKPDIRNFIGMPIEYKALDFADKINFENLKFIVKVISEKQQNNKTILVNPRNIDKLAMIVATPNALEELKKTNSIDDAFEKTDQTGILNKKFRDNLNIAKTSLGDAQNAIQEVKSIDNPKEIKEITEIIEKRVNTIKHELTSGHEVNFDGH